MFGRVLVVVVGQNGGSVGNCRVVGDLYGHIVVGACLKFATLIGCDMLLIRSAEITLVRGLRAPLTVVVVAALIASNGSAALGSPHPEK